MVGIFLIVSFAAREFYPFRGLFSSSSSHLCLARLNPQGSLGPSTTGPTGCTCWSSSLVLPSCCSAAARLPSRCGVGLEIGYHWNCMGTLCFSQKASFLTVIYKWLLSRTGPHPRPQDQLRRWRWRSCALQPIVDEINGGLGEGEIVIKGGKTEKDRKG